MSSGIAAEIKSKLAVVDVVGETVTLKRAGSVFKGLCPFHAEKTPSFIVTPERESWRCFGCGEGGDIFTFLMRRDGMDFREALQRLAERAGVELSERTAREDRRRKRLRDALEQAIAWYREVLLQTHQAEQARSYLAERGMTDETLERFTIGYAPATWQALTRRLGERGFSPEELIAAGLGSPSQRGGIYDRFRGRIIIPIRDASGQPIGLGGRILPGHEGPKYLNSPATPLFDKGRTLFAIDLAKGAIRREKLAVIVEGYTDVMAAHQAGFTNVVASLGTALTRGQIELATRYADAVALAYDVDLAGEAATQRGLIEELGPDQSVSKVRVVRIAAGKDPDELIRTDPDAWRAAVTDAKPVMEYFMERAAAAVDLRSVEGRREMSRRVLGLLRRVGDPLERTLYLQQLARVVDIDERKLEEALAREPDPRRSTQPPPESVPVEAGLSPLETQALSLLLRHPNLATELGEGQLVLRDATAAALVRAWEAQVANGGPGDIDAFLASVDAASADLARAILDAEHWPRLDVQEAREVLRVCILRLRGSRIEETLRDGRLLLEEAVREGDRQRIEEIEQKLDRLGREKAEVTRAIHEPARLAGSRRS
jgi:DNA primase